MYAASKVAERLALAQEALRFIPEYHSVEEVTAFESYLQERGKYSLDEFGKPSELDPATLTDFDRRWILNEQALCMCNPPEAPIWMSDFTFKPIGEIKVGDEIIGWRPGIAKNKRGSRHPRWKPPDMMCKSKVLAVMRRMSPLIKITLESGRVIRCTPDHLWSDGGSNRCSHEWINAKVGAMLRRVVDVYSNDPPDLRTAAWLGGIYDGEGSHCQINQYKIHRRSGENPIFVAIQDALVRLGISHTVSKNSFVLTGGKIGAAKFLAWCKPKKRHQLERNIFRMLKSNPDRIISIEPDGQGEVVSMTTDTGNYIAWGYASKNCDASYWLTRYAYVKDEENVIRRFGFRVAQRILFEIISDLEERDSAIEIMILKARQLGMSTLVELLISHRIIFSYGVNAVIGSADQTKTGLMSNMLFLAYDMMPIWLKPKWTRRVESDRGMLVFGSLASGVSFQHGAQASGIARGTTPTIYHLSECASFTEPEQQIEASLFKAVHESPAVFGVLESSGEGDKGWWPDTWRQSKANWSRGRARLCPLFLPWFCGIGIWPTPTWEHMHPVPPDWYPNRDTSLHVAKSELFVRSNPLLARHLIAEQQSRETFTPPYWRMPRTQQWFWEVEHEQAKSKNMESLFLQEMAGDDEEALQRSSESVFGHETIAEIDTHRQREYLIYGLSGQSIEESHEPPTDLIDYTSGRERIPVRYQSRTETYRWELVPLAFGTSGRQPLDEADPLAPTGMLLVWHPPRPGVSYSIGVDTSEGKGEDSTVISVWALGSRTQPDVQAAEFASAYVSHVEAFAFVLAIAAYYRQYMEVGVTRWKEPYVSIEQVAAVGDTCQLQMQRMGYSNFHRMSRYDSSTRRILKQKSSGGKRGWYTYGWSRPILTGAFVHAARNNWANINSPWLIEEMRHFETKVTATGKEKMEHEEGEHDDRIFAAAMSIFCPHDMDILAERSKRRSVEEIALPPIDTDPYSLVITDRERKETTTPSLEDVIYSGPAGPAGAGGAGRR